MHKYTQKYVTMSGQTYVKSIIFLAVNTPMYDHPNSEDRHSWCLLSFSLQPLTFKQIAIGFVMLLFIALFMLLFLYSSKHYFVMLLLFNKLNGPEPQQNILTRIYFNK